MRTPKLTIRGRLTLVYGGLFVLAGLLLLSVTYLLVSRQLNGGKAFIVHGDLLGAPSGAPPTPDITYGLNTAQQAVDATRSSAMSALLTQGAIALVVVAAIATAFGWLVAGRLLQPLHRMTATARRIADAPAADRVLHERIALDGPHDELRELADTFDVMLARLDSAFDGQRRFIANASHEIRTPLALSRTLLEVALDGSPAAGERQLATTLLAVNVRHERLIDGLLLLARSEQEVADRSYVDLADVLEHVAEPLDAVTTTADEAPTTGNPVLLERIVQNLVDNAVRYNLPADGWVRASTGPGPDGTVVLKVTNPGPVIAPYDIPGLFEPFRRLAADRLVSSSSGAGLGLSIVRAITRAHGGTVTAEPREGGGLVVTVTLPGA